MRLANPVFIFNIYVLYLCAAMKTFLFDDVFVLSV